MAECEEEGSCTLPTSHLADLVAGLPVLAGLVQIVQLFPVRCPIVLICSHGAVHACLSQMRGAVKSWGRDLPVLCSRCTSMASPGSFLRGAQGHLPNTAVPRVSKVSLPRGKNLSVVVTFTILGAIFQMCSLNSQIGNLIPSATMLEGGTFKKC